MWLCASTVFAEIKNQNQKLTRIVLNNSPGIRINTGQVVLCIVLA